MSVKVEVHNQIIAKFPLLALRSQNRQTGGSYFTKSCGYGAILISRDWIRRLVPLYFWERGKLPHILPKRDGALIRRLVVAKRRNI